MLRGWAAIREKGDQMQSKKNSRVCDCTGLSLASSTGERPLPTITAECKAEVRGRCFGARSS